MHVELLLMSGPATAETGLKPFSDTALQEFRDCSSKVGLLKFLVDPSTVQCAELRQMLEILQGLNTHPMQLEEQDMDTSESSSSQSSTALGSRGIPFSKDPLGLSEKGVVEMEAGEVPESPHPPQPMEQATGTTPWSEGLAASASPQGRQVVWTPMGGKQILTLRNPTAAWTGTRPVVVVVYVTVTTMTWRGSKAKIRQ